VNLLTFAELLDLLGHDDHVALCTSSGGIFSSQVVTAAHARLYQIPQDRDVWFSANPMQGPPRVLAGRGDVDQVVRLSSLYADLDVKPGGLTDFAAARAVIDDLSSALHVRPSAMVLSGNGMQPYWPIEDMVTGLDAMALLRRWGRLVRHFAGLRGGKVDSVYDLTRILRMPGSQNHKGSPAKNVVGIADTGRPLAVEEILDALLEQGVIEQPEDRQQIGDVVAPVAGWPYRERTCAYTRSMVDAWANDTADARHPWLVNQATRLAAAWRRGCMAAGDHQTFINVLHQRFQQLLANPPQRSEHLNEFSEAVEWGRDLIARKSDEEVRLELGGHQHEEDIKHYSMAPGEIPTSAQLLSGRVHVEPAPPDVEPSNVLPFRRPAATTDGANALAAQPDIETMERSEDGHALELIAAFGSLIRYCPERKLWLRWDGIRWEWQPPSGGAVREYAKEVARGFPAAGGDSAAVSHKRKSLSSNGISGCLKLAETDPRVVVHMPQLDADPYILNTPAGVINLKTGQISAPKPEMLCTKITTAAPLNEPNPDWEKFLADTFGDDLELRDYIRRIAGLTLVGTVLEQILPFLHGQGANGKSTLAEALMHALGMDDNGYATAAASEMLMVRKHSEHPAEMAQLAGKRMVKCSELDDGQKFAETRIKDLTGRDSLNARFLYGQPFNFAPTFTIWLLGNQRPQARTGGLAFWRRVKLLEFKNVVPAERRDPALGEKLNAAAGAILGWAITGAVDYFTNGMREPVVVTEATRAYAEDQDTIGRFVAEHCGLPPHLSTQVSVFRQAYESWCREIGEEPASARRLTQELRDRFSVAQGATRGKHFYRGIVLIQESEEGE
jgi:P4 family phage/plasmid primase-like protien